MRFAALSYLPLLWLVPAVLVLYFYAFARKRQALAVFMDHTLASRLLPGYNRRRQWLKAFCLTAAVGLLVLALMQPQWGIRWEDVPSQGRNLMLLLDVSRSMLAEDVAPNRLERAKAAVRELVQVIQKEGGHRLGLVVFASRATLHCPLTLDYAFFLQRLNEVDSNSVAPGGTAISEAIRQALQSLATGDQTYKDIVLLTDGEDHHSSPLEAAQTAAAQQVSLYTIGIGDARTGARIPVQDARGHGPYLQYQGEEVRSRLQESLLQEMARLTGGVYMAAGTRPLAMERLYKEHIAPKARRHIDAAAGEYLVHRYHWFVLAALLLLAVDMLVQERAPHPSLPLEGGGRGRG
jgi:Ca-activated chloride channel family protein